MGTLEALFAVNVIIQKCQHTTEEIGFIDYEKAFDRVQHKMPINLSHESQVDVRIIRIMSLWQVLRVKHQKMSETWALSSLLFDLFKGRRYQ